MPTKKKNMPPDWKKWAGEIFLNWYDRNKPEDLELPEVRTSEAWSQWGENIYLIWYELNKPENIETADSNPTDPPPPPPGPVKPS